MNLTWLITLSVFLVVGGDHFIGDDTRLKLCGREFIRMVVTSCGSSRLRRSALELKPLRQMIGGQTVLSEDDEQLDESSSERLEENRTAGTQTVPSHRTPRDAGPAGVCCQSGCTMSELVQYC